MQTQKQLTKSEKIDLGTKEIARRIRKELKDIKGTKFSVTMKSFSGGSEINVSLMESDFKVIKDFKDVSERAINFLALKRNEDVEQVRQEVKEEQNKKYHQLSEYAFQEEYDPNKFNNGVFLTKEGHELFKQVCAIISFYNFDESDPMTDYFNVNFYPELEIGKFNKDYEYKGGEE